MARVRVEPSEVEMVPYGELSASKAPISFSGDPLQSLKPEPITGSEQVSTVHSGCIDCSNTPGEMFGSGSPSAARNAVGSGPMMKGRPPEHYYYYCYCPPTPEHFIVLLNPICRHKVTLMPSQGFYHLK